MSRREGESLFRGFCAWLRRSRRERGVVRALGYGVAQAINLLWDLTPARRRLRYGDLDFDWEHRVDTTWSNISWRTRLREIFVGAQYQPVDPTAFRDSLNALDIDFTEYVFIDLGCGKGRALLLASEYPFRRIVGVEIIPELRRIAEQNIAGFASAVHKCRDIQCFCGDAREFEFPPEATLLYLFNPFPKHVLEEILGAFQQSLRERQRKAVIVYHNPVLKEDVERASGLRDVLATRRFIVYANSMALPGDSH